MKKKETKYSPKEELKMIKLMMEYDTSKTLSENKGIILEQDLTSKTLSDISKKIRYYLTGDVQSNDLSKISNVLNTHIFGKNFEDGGCALNKLIQYYEKDTKNAGFKDIFGTSAILTLGLSDALRSSNLISQISDSEEGSEGAFEDIKRKLLSDIDNELKTFCKTNTTKIANDEEFKKWYSKKYWQSEYNSNDWEDLSVIIDKDTAIITWKDSGINKNEKFKKTGENEYSFLSKNY